MESFQIIEVLVFILTGIVGGFLTALLGIGGGLLYVSIYSTLIPELNPLQLISFSLISIALTSVLTAVKNRNKLTSAQISISLGALLTLLLSKYCLQFINFNGKLFSIILLIAIIYMVIRKIKKSKEFNNPLPTVLTGAISGLVSSVTGLGGGIVLNPLLGSNYNSEKKLVEHIINIIALSTGLYSIGLIGYQYLFIPEEFILIQKNIIFILTVFLGTVLSKNYAKQLSNKISDNNRIIIFLVMVVVLTANTIYQLI